jgi:L-asparaginase
LSVVVIFTGGTISMRADRSSGGRVPTFGAEETLAMAGLEGAPSIELLDWGSRPSSHLSLADVIELARELRRQLLGRQVTGAVVIQGTDTMAETSFVFDLLVESEKPVVVTGAMRAADDEPYDGPRNLRDALVTASAAAFAGQGTIVAMGGWLFAADDVVKAHATDLDSFRAPNFGPLGHVEGSELVMLRRRESRRHVSTTVAAEPVPLLTAALGETGALLQKAAPDLVGLVVEAFGAGQTHPGLLEAARPLLESGRPVVLATRSWAGSPAPLYGYEGSAIAWRQAGAILAGRLDGPKARIALSLGLGAGLDRFLLEELLADPPGYSRVRHPRPLGTSS